MRKYLQKIKIAGETGAIEVETDESPKKLDIGRVIESYC